MSCSIKIVTDEKLMSSSLFWHRIPFPFPLFHLISLFRVPPFKTDPDCWCGWGAGSDDMALLYSIHK